MAAKTTEQSPRNPQNGQRKVSFSDTLTRLKTNSFTRRRTAPDIATATSSSDSSTTAISSQEAVQGKATRVPRSSSFFSSLNPFSPRSAKSNNTKEDPAVKPKSLKHTRTYSQRVSQPPSSFFNTSAPPQDVIEPLLPTTITRTLPKRRESVGTHITQRALMRPISNLPLPRRSTMGGSVPGSSNETPSFMRPTSSSAARRAAPRQASRTSPLPKKVTSTKPRHRVSDQSHQRSKLSILSSPPQPEQKVQAEAVAADPLKMNSDLDIEHCAGLPSPGIYQDNEISSTTNLLASGESKNMAVDSVLPSPGHFEDAETNTTPNLLTELDAKETAIGSVLPSTSITPINQGTEMSSTTDLPTKPKSKKAFMVADALSAEDDEAEQEDEFTLVPNPLHITTHQPIGYWAGRVSALSDRFRTEALASPQSPMHDDGRRMRRIFIHLRSMCVTEQAVDSFEAFKTHWSHRNDVYVIDEDDMYEEDDEQRAADAGPVAGIGAKGKKGKGKRHVFDIVLGRKK